MCVLYTTAALQTCIYQYGTLPKGFTKADDDMPSPRKLKLVAMHMPEWEEVGRTLGIEQDVLDQYKKSNRSVLHLCGRQLTLYMERLL